MAEIFAAKKDYGSAAKLLEKIPLDNTNRYILEDEKVAIYVQIAEHWFDDEDAVNAEKFINKAAHIIHLVKDNNLVIRYKVCHARINDSKRKFSVAAQAYYDLSNQEGVDQGDLQQLLGMGLTCAILAPAGPQKSRIISVYHKDMRSQKLEFYDVLDKMFLGRVIKRPDVKSFDDSLQVHQKTVSQEGYSVLDKALIEHNIEVISKIYTNISFEELGRFLEIDPEKAESIIAQMVSEKRISASLDQMNRMIEFLTEGSAALTGFNNQILNICTNVDNLIQDIIRKQPELKRLVKF